MKTEATASASGTSSRARAVARTASPPTLAGRNVPTKVLTKKTCRRRRGRPAAASSSAGNERDQQPEPAVRHQRPVDDDEEDGGRERTWSRVGGLLPPLGPGALFQSMNAVSPGDGQPEDAAGRWQAGRWPGLAVTSLAAGIDGSVSR